MDETFGSVLQNPFSENAVVYLQLSSSMRNSLRHPNTFNIFSYRTDYFKNSFFPSVVTEWNKLDPDIQGFSSEGTYRNALLKFISSVASKTNSINGCLGLKLLTRLCLGFSHLRE